MCDILNDWVGFLSDVGGALGGIAVSVAAVKYLLERGERKKIAHYEAWRVINSAHGKGGSGGRIDALQDLVAEHISLSGVNLDGAWLHGICLDAANLNGASLRKTDLYEASLVGAKLDGADLNEAVFMSAKLEGSVLARTKSESYVLLSFSNLVGADLTQAQLAGAVFIGTDLSGAILYDAKLPRVNWYEARLAGVDLRGADLSDMEQGWENIASIDRANVWNIKNAPVFRDWALKNGAVEIQSLEEWRPIRAAVLKEIGWNRSTA